MGCVHRGILRDISKTSSIVSLSSKVKYEYNSPLPSKVDSEAPKRSGEKTFNEEQNRLSSSTSQQVS